MPIDTQLANNARSTLNGGISAVATTAAVQGGAGGLFPALSGNQEFTFTLQDAAGNVEICRCTARSGDTFSTIVRGQEGTTARAWADGDKVELRLTKQALDNFVRETIQETQEESIVQATMPTLVADDPDYIVLTPTVASVLSLPTTGVKKGKRFRIVNMATNTAFGIRVNASGGAQVTYAPASNVAPIPVEVMANKDTPTVAADWDVVQPPKGILYVDETQTASRTTVGAFHSITLPADLMYRDGMVLQAKAHGFTQNGLNTFGFRLGTTNISAMSHNPGGATWIASLELIRRAAASEAATGSALDQLGISDSFYVELTEDLTTALALETYLSLASGDLLWIEAFRVELL